MKILMLGQGFIVDNFIEKFGKKHDIVVSNIDLSKIGDVKRLFKENLPDTVVHLAGKTIDEERAASQNLIYFRNLQYAATLYKTRKLLYCVLGEDRVATSDIVGANENYFEGEAVDAFGQSNSLIYRLAKNDKMTTILRLFNVYGKGQKVDESFIIEAMQSAILGRKAKKIKVPFDKTITLTNVDDTVKLINGFLTRDLLKGAYNACSDEKISTMEIARIIQKAAKRHEKEAEVVLLNDDRQFEFTASNLRIKCFFSDFNFVSAKNGLNRLFKLYIEDKRLLK